MGETSGIAWTHATFNAWSGCAKVSAACKHCYAERDTKRYGLALWGEHAERQFRAEAYWRQPEKWNRDAQREGRRRRVFSASLSDVFEVHPNAETHAKMEEARARLWKLIAATPWLDWLLLTKRPENITHLAPISWHVSRAPRNVWLGVTAESQECADERVPRLLAAKRMLMVSVAFVSHEPAIEAVDFRDWLPGANVPLDRAPLSTLDWIITGGESGPGARAYDVAWARDIIEQCRAAGIPAFVKQLGAVAHETRPPSGAPDDGGDLIRIEGLGRSGHDLALLARCGVAVQEFPAAAAIARAP